MKTNRLVKRMRNVDRRCRGVLVGMACLGIVIGSPAACDSADTKGKKVTDQARDSRYERGLKSLESLNAEAAGKVMQGLKGIAPEMSGFIIEFAYGDVYSRPGLDPKSRQVATIAALTALGNCEPQLKFHINGGLNVGLTPEEVIDTMYVGTVFAGFPRGLNGIFAAREVFRGRGISVRRLESKETPEPSRRQLGLETLNLTSKGAGKRVVESLSEIAPEMADFIIDFAYADVFSRPVLSAKDKEVAMIAVCTALGGMEPQMKVHIRAALNVGCTWEELVELMNHMAVYAGFPAALNGISVLKELKTETSKSRDSK